MTNTCHKVPLLFSQWSQHTKTGCKCLDTGQIRDCGHDQLISSGGRFEPAFAERDKKQTMIDLRWILTNLIWNQLCPSVRWREAREYWMIYKGPGFLAVVFFAHSEYSPRVMFFSNPDPNKQKISTNIFLPPVLLGKYEPFKPRFTTSPPPHPVS